MKKTYLFQLSVLVTGICMLFLYLQPVLADTLITGTVTAKRNNAVKVDFTPQKTVAPAIGDPVEFSKIIGDISIKGGTGNVISTESESVWVKITKEHVNLKMNAVIHATGMISIDALLLDSLNALILEKPNKKEALELLWSYSNNGNADATGYLAQIYSYGQGVPKDTKKGFGLAELSARTGSKMGYQMMGNIYANGLGVDVNYSKAMEQYKKAAAIGLDLAMYSIGSMYYKGQGVQQDLVKALEWFQKAADLGSHQALCMLGLYYEFGLAMPKDRDKAVQYFKQSAEKDNPWAKSWLKDIEAQTKP